MLKTFFNLHKDILNFQFPTFPKMITGINHSSFETTKYLNLFTDKWSPALQIRTVLLSIQALLSAPNPDDPLANDVAETWKDNEIQAIETGIYFFILLSILNHTFDRKTFIEDFQGTARIPF